jgi:hypothetical protein
MLLLTFDFLLIVSHQFVAVKNRTTEKTRAKFLGKREIWREFSRWFLERCIVGVYKGVFFVIGALQLAPGVAELWCCLLKSHRSQSSSLMVV